MYPREITTTSVWTRHDLPVCAPPPPNGDAKLRKQIRSRNVKATDEMIERYVRQERARLDLKWCLDDYFGGNKNNPYLGQLVTANINGIVHLAYILELNSTSITVAPVDSLDLTELVGRDDIYSAEDGPFYEAFVETRHLLHPQHVLDCLAKQKHELVQSNYAASFDTSFMDIVQDCIENNWPGEEETWLIHDELPQRVQFTQCKQPMALSISTTNIVEHPMRKLSFNCADTVSSSHMEARLFVNKNQIFDTLLQPREHSPEPITAQTSHDVCDVLSISYQSTFADDQHVPVSISFSSNEDAHSLQTLHLSTIDQRNAKIRKVKHSIHQSSLQQTTVSLFGAFFILLCIISAALFRLTKLNSADSPIIGPVVLTLMVMAPHLILTDGKNAGYFNLNKLWIDTNRDWFRILAVP
jgi:hypothetical protein